MREEVKRFGRHERAISEGGENQRAILEFMVQETLWSKRGNQGKEGMSKGKVADGGDTRAEKRE